MANKHSLQQFQDEVWKYYDQHGRHGLAWRLPGLAYGTGGGFDPYKIMVSELMLQQTQVSRVVPKYQQFLELFPTIRALAVAPLGDVLVAWQGLGYNRRAKYLWQAAQMVENKMGGVFPHGQKELARLPGVGVNTAGAIMAYAYDKPVVFVETNIRTVYIHHFFDDEEGVADKDILELVRQSVAGLQDGGARNWYWALMDYGTHIKQTHGNKSRASKSYVKQPAFEGSRRKVRGAAVRFLSRQPGTLDEMAAVETDSRLPEVLADLVAEGMVREEAGRYRLA